MPLRNLDYLFKPKSVALFGATNRPGAIGHHVMRNLLSGGFEGPIMPVNPGHDAVCGVLTYADAAHLPVVPDLAVIATKPETVPGLIDELGRKGTRAAIVLTAGLQAERDGSGRPLSESMMENARRHGLRVLGPNCLGLIVPGIGLNASFTHQPALAGRLAFVSQSGALCTAVLDWARSNGIGFSHFVSLGNSLDVGFASVLDYLATDVSARAILLYIESVRNARAFISAARAAARNKPVIAIKSGRFGEGARAAFSHTGALAGTDDVYDAAIRRAGMLRVFNTDELFAAVETLARARPLKGERLAILTNGGGLGVLAADALIERQGRLAQLSEETLARLDAVLPSTWSRANPVDIIGDAPVGRYRDTLNVLKAAPEVDAIMVMHAPTAAAAATEVAEAIIESARGAEVNLLTSWVGAETVGSARRRFGEAGLPTYDTPDQAVRAFMHMVDYQRNQELLMETPPSAPSEFTPDARLVRRLVADTLEAGRQVLAGRDAMRVLAAYGVPVVEARLAATPDEAARQATEIGLPVAVKLHSPDITHKSDVGGVVLNLESAEAVRDAAERMGARLARQHPNARIDGFTVQRMAETRGAHELIAGVATDEVFGPILLFGEGGTAVDVIADRAVALPPLNMTLARDMISRTRIYKRLRGYRHRPPVNFDAICLTLIKLSQLVVDIPEVRELDINPLFADETGVLAIDARIRLEESTRPGPDRLAIRPYPQELEESFTMASGRTVILRPIRPEDEPQHHVFVSRLTPEDIRFRFFGILRELPHSQMARLTQIDYDREMAFIATAPDDHARPETLGVVRAIADSDNREAEFAIIVRSDLKGQGLGHKLMEKVLDYLRARGTGWVVGQVLADNKGMLDLARTLGFEMRRLAAAEVYEVRLRLR